MKAYIEPIAKFVQLDKTDIIATSTGPEGEDPTGTGRDFTGDSDWE